MKITEIIKILDGVDIKRGKIELEVSYISDLPDGIKAIRKEHCARFWETPDIQFIIEFCKPINYKEFSLFCSQNGYSTERQTRHYWFRAFVPPEKNVSIFYGFGDNGIITNISLKYKPEDIVEVLKIAEFIEKYIDLITKKSDSHT